MLILFFEGESHEHTGNTSGANEKVCSWNWAWC